MTLDINVTDSRILANFKTLEADCNRVHTHKYSYDKVVYIRSKLPVTITCPIHGDFSQSMSQHKAKEQGCNECAKILKGVTRSNNVARTWIERANTTHNNKFDYSKAVYTKAHLKTTFICPEHGEFEQQIAAHLRGQGCMDCTHKGYHDETFYEGREAILYYLKLSNGLFKIGITCETIAKRYRGEFTASYEVINSWTFSNGADAFKLEQKWLQFTEAFKHTGESVFVNGGNTEVRTIDTLETGLQLIKDFNVQQYTFTL